MSSETDELLRLRAERLKRPRSPPSEDLAVLWVAELSLGGRGYAVLLSRLRGALRPVGLTRVPLAPPWVLGVSPFGGELLTVVSLSALLDRECEAHAEAFLVVEAPDGRRIMLVSEQVPRPAALAVTKLDDADEETLVVPVTTAAGHELELIKVERLLEFG